MNKSLEDLTSVGQMVAQSYINARSPVRVAAKPTEQRWDDFVFLCEIQGTVRPTLMLVQREMRQNPNSWLTWFVPWAKEYLRGERYFKNTLTEVGV